MASADSPDALNTTDGATWCPTCLNLDLNPPEDVRQATDQYSYEGRMTGCRHLNLARDMELIRSTAQDGCRKCEAIAQVVDFFSPCRSSGLVMMAVYPRGNPVVWVSSGTHPVSEELSFMVRLYTPLGLKPAWPGLGLLPELSPSHRSPEALAFVRDRLTKCLEEHRLCNVSTPGTRPTRLLDIGRDGDAQIRLVSGDTAGSAAYGALTYCWGGDVAVKATAETVLQLQSGVPLSTLPQTFQDAINLARDLGLSHLWIDALCILQDSLQEWEAEAAAMAAIYCGARVTLAAASASAASEGFLRPPQQRPRHAEFSAPWTAADGSPTVLKARLDATGGFLTSHMSMCEPWARRGWTMQEHVLSPRTVLFSDAEIQWVCREDQTCECGGVDTFAHRSVYASVFGVRTPRAAFRFWRFIVGTYSARRLTHPDDKLPALAGIASVLKEQTASRYVAGLWEADLVRDLCWHRRHLTPYASVPRAYRAPTFSWASIDDEVEYMESIEAAIGEEDQFSDPDTWVPLTRYVDCFSRVDGRNPLGRVRDASVTLRGHLLRCLVRPMETYSRRCWLLYGSERRHLELDDELAGFSFRGADGSPQLSAARRSSWERNSGSYPSDIISAAERRDMDLPAWALHLGFFPSDLFTRHVYLILGRSVRNPSQYERLALYSDEPLSSPLFVGQERLYLYLDATITVI